MKHIIILSLIFSGCFLHNVEHMDPEEPEEFCPLGERERSYFTMKWLEQTYPDGVIDLSQEFRKPLDEIKNYSLHYASGDHNDATFKLKFDWDFKNDKLIVDYDNVSDNIDGIIIDACRVEKEGE